MQKMVWCPLKFSAIFKHSPKSAFEYRKNALGDEIPAEYSENKEKKNLSIEEMKGLLRANKIKIFNGWNSETLLKKCVENNLI